MRRRDRLTASSGVTLFISELIHHASCFAALARSCQESGPGARWRSSHGATLSGLGDPARPEEDAGFLPRRDGSNQPRCYGAAEAWQLTSGSGVR
jgi:hypothetical protein